MDYPLEFIHHISGTTGLIYWSVIIQTPIMKRSEGTVKPNPKVIRSNENKYEHMRTNLKKLILLEDRKNVIKTAIAEEIGNLIEEIVETT